MNLTDVAIIMLAITAGARGIELGLLRQSLSAIGLLLGLLLGAWLQQYAVGHVQTPGSKALVVLLVVVSCALLLMNIGEFLGIALKQKLQHRRLHVLEKADKAAGALIGAALLILVVWLSVALFNRVPVAALQKQLQGSVIISSLNQLLPNAPQSITRAGQLIAPNGFPDVFEGLEPHIDTDKPLPSIGELDKAVASSRSAVVKVVGDGCGSGSSGSGFVAAPGTVITNAHVVAGIAKPSIIDARGQHAARVIWFDPELDIAILRSSAVAAAPLPLQPTAASDGSPVAAVGYPGGGDFTASPGAILTSFIAVGRDIYNQQTTERRVYFVKTQVAQGNSGGPLLNARGEVIGVIFAKSNSYDDVGYALMMQPVVRALEQAAADKTVSTGGCTAR